MIAGILSVAVIVLTQSFYDSTETSQKKAATEQTPEQNTHAVTISAPSDMVPHGNAVAVNHQQPSVLEKFSRIEKPKRTSVIIKNTVVTFFKTLFRVIIAPNAP